MYVQPYLFFGGRCEEASEFYHKAIGAEIVTKLRFKDAPEPPPPGVPTPDPEKIMHMAIKVGDSTFMAADGCNGPAVGFQGVSMTISVSKPEEADKVFNALSEGGSIVMPMGPTFFSPRFGMVKDKFGLGWTILTTGNQPAN